jgi:hypothetical protein
MAFSGAFRSPFVSPFGDSPSAAVDFADTLVNVYGASEVWKLTDIVSGTTIPAHVDPARNGVLTGWDLQNTASPVVGDAGLAPYSDGTNDYGNIQSANLASLFNGAIGSLSIFGKVVNAAVWTNGVNGRLLNLEVNGNNRVSLLKAASPNNRLTWAYIAGGTVRSAVFDSGATTDWFNFTFTWNKFSADRVRAYFNGVQQGADVTGLGTWAGALATSLIGAFTTTPTQVFNGWSCYPTLWTTELSPAQVAAIYTDAIS